MDHILCKCVSLYQQHVITVAVKCLFCNTTYLKCVKYVKEVGHKYGILVDYKDSNNPS